jgi:L-cysteate sulfo-lyase
MTDVFNDARRIDLGFTPTPLEPLDRFSNLLGGPRIWIKRDDCTGLATGGNKTRKLEYLMADAKSRGADTVITFGAVQSNHARQTAAACAKLGLECHLVLTRRVAWTHPEYESSGNVLLDRVLGAHVHFAEATNVDAMARDVLEDLTGRGRHCYSVPTGGSNPIGAMGYMRCAAEIVDQSHDAGFEPGLIVHATSSGGTQAGLIAGLIARNADIGVLGVNVYDPDHARLERRIARLLADTLGYVGLADKASPPVRIVHEFLGQDYGIPTSQTIEAIRTLAATEGIVTDPVYSGKALGALIEMIRRGELASHDNAIFIHTGGTASLPMYSNAF